MSTVLLSSACMVLALAALVLAVPLWRARRDKRARVPGPCRRCGRCARVRYQASRSSDGAE